MGQANSRGTREERIAQSIERRRLEAIEQQRLQREYESKKNAEFNALPPRQKQMVLDNQKSTRDAQMALAAVLGMAGSLRFRGRR